MAPSGRARTSDTIREVKLALIGGGGFRTPLIWESVANVANDVDVDTLVLYDTSEARLGAISAVVEGMRRERLGPPIETTTILEEAVEGAGAILCAIRVGGLEARVVDESVPLREGVLGQETVGPGGICFALRTVPVILDIARVAGERAPSAWFVNFTNPAGLVTEALRSVVEDRVVGICDSPTALCGHVAAALGRRVDDLVWDYAGLNHLGWLLAVRDGDTDLLPGLLADARRLESIEEARLIGTDEVAISGTIPNEYLVYYERPAEIRTAIEKAGRTRAEILLEIETKFFSGDRSDPIEALFAWRRARDARFGSYMAEARGPGSTEERVDPHPWPTPDGQLQLGYGAIAAAFLRASSGGEQETLILNVANRGLLDYLDDEAVIEVPCVVGVTGVRAVRAGRLPERARRLVERVKEVERLTIRAALRRSRALALEALVAHPLVPSRDVADRILGGYLSSIPELAARLE
jgi:6-phospho-beta-glucosidase